MDEQPYVAFEDFLHPHLPRLFRLARSLVRELADADDIVQEACIKAFRAFHQFQPGTSAKAWLITILLNTYRDWVRKTLRTPRALNIDELVAQLQATDDPEQTTLRSQRTQRIRLAMQDLPPEFQTTVMLADIEGLTYREIADAMNCPIGTVMSRLYRGRHLLHATLHPVLEE